MKKRIIIEMEGCLIQNVYTNFNTGNLEVILVDHDLAGADDENIFSIPETVDNVYIQKEKVTKNTPWVEDVFKILNGEV